MAQTLEFGRCDFSGFRVNRVYTPFMRKSGICRHARTPGARVWIAVKENITTEAQRHKDTSWDTKEFLCVFVVIFLSFHPHGADAREGHADPPFSRFSRERGYK